MKKTLTFLILLFAVTAAAFAQSTLTFSYQSVVRNANNRLVQDSSFTIDIQVLEGSTVRYSETRTVTTDHNGMVSFFIGSATGRTSSSGALNDVTDWSQVSFVQTYHLNTGDVVATDPVSPVPYALQALNSSTSTDATNLSNRVNEFNTHVCDSVAACLNGTNNALSQQIIKIVNDTLGNGGTNLNHTVDTIAENVTLTELGDGTSDINHAVDTIVENVTLTELGDGTSDINLAVDTIVENHITAYNEQLCAKVIACEEIKHMRDSIQLNRDTIRQLANSLPSRIVTTVIDTLKLDNSVLNHVIDTIAENVTLTELRDGASDINHAVDTIAENVTLTELRDGASDINHAVDTIAENVTLTELRDGASDINLAIDTICEANRLKAYMDIYTVTDPDHPEFTLSYIPVVNNQLVKLYINGIMVGGYTATMTGTPITVSGNIATYVPTYNLDACSNAYTLKVGDRVIIEYWYK